jgi:cytochrome c-type biogenesis protein CcmH
VVAGVFCVLAVGVLIVPLWRRHGLASRWSGAGVAAALAIVPVAVGLYFHLTNYDPAVAERAHESNRLVDALAERLQGMPDDLNGWRLLANSYMALGRYDEGWAAYEHIWSRTPVPDAELTISYAEAQILTDRGNLSGEAGRLIESALTADPVNPKALWYGGLVAIERGQRDVARTRWTSLLAMNLPEDIDTMVRGRLAELSGGGTPPPALAAAGNGAPPAASGPTIKLNVTLGPGRAVADLGPNAQLFIFARAPEGGPPLAVLRQPAGAVPGEFTLSDANSMIQGRSIGNYPEVTLVARLSRSGQPTAQPGDWEAEAVAKPSDTDPIALVIDRVVQ